MRDSSRPHSPAAPLLPFTSPYFRELETAIDAVLAAGPEILRFYVNSGFSQYSKVDGSPVTDADLAADRVIRSVIQRTFPADPLLTEEGHDDPRRLQSRRCWIVDPIDGTEQFIRHTGEFDVLVAFVDGGRPAAVAGFQPTTATLVIAETGQGTWVSVEGGAFFRFTLEYSAGPPRIASSKWFGAPENSALIASIAGNLDGADPAGPSEIGFTPRMFLAPRVIDAMIGIRVGDVQDMASEWDFAVTDLVIAEAGGVVTDLTGKQLEYNKNRPVNVGGLLASVSPGIHARLLASIREVRSNI